MSFFGTLRKVKKGKVPTQHHPENLLDLDGATDGSSSLILSNSNSTPNLNRKLFRAGIIGDNRGEDQQQTQLRLGIAGAGSNNSFSVSTTTDEDYDSQSTGGESVETPSTSSTFHAAGGGSSSSFDVSSLKSVGSTGSSPSRGIKTKKGSFSFTTGNLTKFVSMIALGSHSANNTPKINRKKHISPISSNDPSQRHHINKSSANNTNHNVQLLHSPANANINNNNDASSHYKGYAKELRRSRTYSEDFPRFANGKLEKGWSQTSEDGGEMERERQRRESASELQAADVNRRKKDLLLSGVKKFNRNAEKGMNFLILNNLVENSPEAIAAFLKTNENLSKTAIGDFLGIHGEFHETVLRWFVQYHDLEGKPLVDALRQFLQSFRLPGEAQKIDRMMETFASHYCEQNPGIFQHQDTCYILSFAIIMLNTTLHNHNIKDKPTVDQFIQMNRGIDNGQSLDPEYLTFLYNSIRNEEFKIPKEDHTSDLKLAFYNADKKGWLWKQGARYKNSWKRRWFILSNNCLYYFRFPEETIPRSIIPLENIEAKVGHGNSSSGSSPSNKYYFFYLVNNTKLLSPSSSSSPQQQQPIKSCKTLSDGRMVLGSHSEYVLGTTTPLDRDDWLNCINKNGSFSSCYTLLQQKKRNMTALQMRSDQKFLSPATRSKQARMKKPTVRKSQISMPVERPETPEIVSTIHIHNNRESESTVDFSPEPQLEPELETPLENVDHESLSISSEQDLHVDADQDQGFDSDSCITTTESQTENPTIKSNEPENFQENLNLKFQEEVEKEDEESETQIINQSRKNSEIISSSISSTTLISLGLGISQSESEELSGSIIIADIRQSMEDSEPVFDSENTSASLPILNTKDEEEKKEEEAAAAEEDESETDFEKVKVPIPALSSDFSPPPSRLSENLSESDNSYNFNVDDNASAINSEQSPSKSNNCVSMSTPTICIWGAENSSSSNSSSASSSFYEEEQAVTERENSRVLILGGDSGRKNSIPIETEV